MTKIGMEFAWGVGGEGDRLNETAESHTEYCRSPLTKSSAAGDE